MSQIVIEKPYVSANPITAGNPITDANGNTRPCDGFMVSTSGNVSVRLAGDTANVTLAVTAGVIYPISVQSLNTGTGFTALFFGTLAPTSMPYPPSGPSVP